MDSLRIVSHATHWDAYKVVWGEIQTRYRVNGFDHVDYLLFLWILLHSLVSGFNVLLHIGKYAPNYSRTMSNCNPTASNRIVPLDAMNLGGFIFKRRLRKCPSPLDKVQLRLGSFSTNSHRRSLSLVWQYVPLLNCCDRFNLSRAYLNFSSLLSLA